MRQSAEHSRNHSRSQYGFAACLKAVCIEGQSIERVCVTFGEMPKMTAGNGVRKVEIGGKIRGLKVGLFMDAIELALDDLQFSPYGLPRRLDITLC